MVCKNILLAPLRRACMFLILTLSTALNIAIADYVMTAGESVNFKKLAQEKKWVIVHYWAGWCGVCVDELPVYNELLKLKNQNFRLFGVYLDSVSDLDPVKFERIKSDYEVIFPHFLKDPRHELGIKQIEYVPTTVFISPEGKIAKIKTGPLTKREILKIIGE